MKRVFATFALVGTLVAMSGCNCDWFRRGSLFPPIQPAPQTATCVDPCGNIYCPTPCPPDCTTAAPCDSCGTTPPMLPQASGGEFYE